MAHRKTDAVKEVEVAAADPLGDVAGDGPKSPPRPERPSFLAFCILPFALVVFSLTRI